MHLSSLPTPYGIGTMGQSARDFVDFLKKAGQKYWQILPVCPTSYGDSPYQSFSTFAGNPYFIDLDELRKEGLLELEDYTNINWGSDATKVDYETIYKHRFRILKYAFYKFDKDNKAYIDFCKENEEWLNNYAEFMAVKDVNGGISWVEWKEGLKLRDPEVMYIVSVLYEEDIEFWKFVQFKFFEQWNALRKYANDNGVENDKHMRSLEWMKAPVIFNNAKGIPSRHNNSSIRRIIARNYFGSGRHKIRFRLLGELSKDVGFDYLEFVPLNIINDPLKPEDRH